MKKISRISALEIYHLATAYRHPVTSDDQSQLSSDDSLHYINATNNLTKAELING